MEMSALVSKIEKALPGAILQKKPFGRSGDLSLWIEARQLRAVAQLISEDPLAELDWLEHLGAAEVEGAILLSYFVRSTRSDRSVILRSTVVPRHSEAEAEFASVSELWPMAEAMENEVTELFGIRFVGNTAPRLKLLPEGWEGFPLRKSYVFPVEFAGISHMRLTESSAGSDGEI